MMQKIVQMILLGLCIYSGVVFGNDRTTSHQYLFAWFHDPMKDDPAFLATIDIQPSSTTYGKVVASILGEGIGKDAHHTNHFLPKSNILFANDFMGGRTHIFDLNKALKPKRMASFSKQGDFTFPHSFVELPNGNILSTFQTIGQGNVVPGGLVEMTPEGKMIRSALADDGTVKFLRPYSLEYLPKLDRVIMVSADMMAKDITLHYQLWKQKDLSLIGTFALPKAPRKGAEIDPMEARVLADGETVLITTYNCGLYRVDGLQADKPIAHFIHDFEGKKCAIPVVIDKYWIEAVGQTESAGGKIEVLDISNPAIPKMVYTLSFNKGYEPHWIAANADGNRIALSGYGKLEKKIVILDFDKLTGTLTIDQNFGDRDEDGIVGVNTNRMKWPHGETGPAIPHGLVFSN